MYTGGRGAHPRLRFSLTRPRPFQTSAWLLLLPSSGGRLSLDGYLNLGRKRAHAFGEDGRRALYPIFERYEAVKRERRLYDTTDLVYSLHSRLAAGGWPGTPLHSIARDEVQDFLQARRARACAPRSVF